MQDTAQQFFAVVVGVGAYVSPKLANLDATATDARILRDVLTNPAHCGYAPANTHLLSGEGASLGEFRAQLAWLAASTDDSATALIYFSGHGGYHMQAPSTQRYLFLRHTDTAHLPETALSTDEFADALRLIRAGRLVVILDACYAAGAAMLKGDLATSDSLVAGVPVETIEGLSKGKGRVVLASSTASQPSFVRAEGDASLFTHHLVDALRGAAAIRRDGYIHILDVFHYVSEAVRAMHPDQTPILKADDLDSNFPIAFDHGRNGSAEVISRPAVEPLDTIREIIIASPEAGALALSRYLAANPGSASLRTEVDLIRERLQAIQREMKLSDTVQIRGEHSRLIYLLLERCLRIEQGAYYSVRPDEIDGVVAPFPQLATPAEPRTPSIQVTISPGRDAYNIQTSPQITNYYYAQPPDQVRTHPSQAQQGNAPKDGQADDD